MTELSRLLLGGDVPRGSVIHVDHAMGELTYLVRTTSTAGGVLLPHPMSPERDPIPGVK